MVATTKPKLSIFQILFTDKHAKRTCLMGEQAPKTAVCVLASRLNPSRVTMTSLGRPQIPR